MRVIEIIPGQLLTNCVGRPPQAHGGRAGADPNTDLAKIAVIERHHATGRIGLGFVTGFGLKKGAFASTVAHDAHNVVVVGMDDDDMTMCAHRLQVIGGGIVVAAGNQVLAELPLAVAGLLSEEPFETVVERLDAAHAALASLGVGIEAPFMTLSFLALSVIPKLKITDRGLIDVDEFALVPLELD
jgi:adenine deaminase